MDEKDEISTIKAKKSTISRLRLYMHSIPVESLDAAINSALDVAEKKKKK